MLKRVVPAIAGLKKVLFTDELGGGGQPTCNSTVGPKRGADAASRSSTGLTRSARASRSSPGSTVGR